MDYAIAKEYPMFYETHRFMIVFTGACLFSTHTHTEPDERSQNPLS